MDNRGKLNLPAFHVAMGLIYRGESLACLGKDLADEKSAEWQ